MWRIGIICLLLVSSNTASPGKKRSKYVTTLINANWRDTPIILEAAEYLNDKNPNYFWKFIDTVSRNSDANALDAHEETDKERYDRLINHTSNFLTSTENALLKLSLSLRTYSARIEMFSQMGENRRTEKVEACNNFVDVHGELTCSSDEVENLLESIENRIDGDDDDDEERTVYSLDHQYPVPLSGQSESGGKSKITGKYVILYGQIGSVGFSDFHEKLKGLADAKKIVYILRHYVRDRPEHHLRLGGYGVELHMKSTEYKATDDSDIKDNSGKEEYENEGVEEINGINFGVLRSLYPDKHAELDKFEKHLLETSDEIGALKVWQFQELSHQAAERIMKSPSQEAIKVLTDIAQNFPMQAKSLIRTKVSSEMKKEIKRNQELFFGNLHIQPTDTVLFINGLFFDLDTIDILGLLETLRAELTVMETLHKIGVSSSKMEKLLALDLSGSHSSDNNQDFAIDIRDSAVIWVNDLENDSRYNRWSPSLTSLLRPTFPGMLRNIRRNLYNLILIIDPLSPLSKPLIATAETLYAHSAPIRVGFVFNTNFDPSLTGQSDPSIAVNNAFHYLLESKSAKEAVYFLSVLLNDIEKRKSSGNNDNDSSENGVEVSDVVKALRSRDPSADVDDIFGENSDYDVGRPWADDFIRRTGFKVFPQALLNGVPLEGISSIVDGESLEDIILKMIFSQTPMLQKAVYKGEVTEGDDIVDFMMNQPNVMPRLNERVLKNDKTQWLNLVGEVPTTEDVSTWGPEDTSAWIIKNSNYLYMPRRKKSQHLYTYWIVTNLEHPDGRLLLREALEYLKSNADARLAVILNSNVDQDDSVNISVNKIVLSVLSADYPAENHNKIIRYIQEVIGEKNAALIEKGEFDRSKYHEHIGTDFDENANHEFMLKVHKHFANIVLRMDESSTTQRAVICNGRIIGPLDDGENFSNQDFALLERFSHSTYGEKLITNLEKIHASDDEEEQDISDDVIMEIASLLVPRLQTRSRYEVLSGGEDHSVVKIPASNPDQVAFNIIAIVDPVSRGAQKLGTILNTLQQALNCNIKIFLNCVDKNSDMPLKNFYRFVFEPELQFNSDGQLVGASAKFNKLPTSSLLTQNIHAPDNWMVQVVKSVYDLDNIKLDNVAIGVHSEFELEYLLLEGHCFEATMGNPPRGLQITLGTETHAMVDTIVMANLGYFQLKANPGEWILRLRHGRSAEIYNITSVDGHDVIQNGNGVRVLISSLKSHVLKLKVTKKSDKLDMDLLAEDDDKKSGIWNSISRTFGSDDAEEQEEKINIFSLASGHLYERFLKIMMLSVLKHTKSPVKFWFLKNYLSPTLKDFLPHMAKVYGFEYELIQYKWPRWLHQQTEKQRTIWGYKILFLDVLFPLDVKKIIFVDADQVVRADLKELVNLDLEGAPYAYTPFCDSRKEMDGFRFWKQGYWKTHLQGRAYHISALYVVDLKRFRRIAAGDRLRGQYQALSPDPNSLSNLDQDLPNNMIHQVAVKTLPQEWLWCETWCSDASKKYAKTIDLCNNPMTKEAKLQAAIRILPEWTGYDEEIKALQHAIENENKQTDKEEKVDSDDQTKHEEL
ncbi:UDP-glucose:glycoprotein glucosyltransferase isoform X2 [Diachasma alloeum]|uniref:UDP-glucose:glycoprotein glucosyltransferase isoform X2 n=1 Tax=Diachasma alloeum TaxID=454923 RepID=UPI000738324D|nr:UDP-glucose:glycoprotein glucosyltransferase isoform X2 [Diachasma alloeum]